jgi:hypothetical protein
VPSLRNRYPITIEVHQALGLHTNEFTHTSDQLLDALLRLRTAEQDLRHLRISSEAFHRLAEEVEGLRDELSALARDGRVTGTMSTPTVDGWTGCAREVRGRPRRDNPPAASSSGLG